MNDRLIINVGRQFGSGGKLVAMELGRLLGINVYDNELISKAAQVSGFSSEIFLKNDEKRSIFSFSSLFTPNLTGQENCLDDGALFKIQSRVIEDIAAGESAVIVGRCADYILRDRGCTLDIFITSPLEERKKRVSERMEISLEKAEDIIIRNDRKRETYYNYFTLGNWGVASNYDLCIDSSILGIEGTAKYIIDFARKAGYIG
ncbi:MAG: cytidylate kinase-like family protein [Bacteroidales bacterium]|nr:cytidylate kinase-like family protein [Bacteroidales bacterium]